MTNKNDLTTVLSNLSEAAAKLVDTINKVSDLLNQELPKEGYYVTGETMTVKAAEPVKAGQLVQEAPIDRMREPGHKFSPEQEKRFKEAMAQKPVILEPTEKVPTTKKIKRGTSEAMVYLEQNKLPGERPKDTFNRLNMAGTTYGAYKQKVRKGMDPWTALTTKSKRGRRPN